MTTLVYDPKKIRAIIGLGNPGKKYHFTRHNIGFRIVDALADAYGASWQSSDKLEYATIKPFDDAPQIYLVKPQTFMNSSGDALNFLLKKGITASEIIVAHDELEKPFGARSFRFGGSAKGHNGLKSIIQRIGMDFWRYRFGISRPADRAEVGDYVLTPFLTSESSAVETMLGVCASELVSR